LVYLARWGNSWDFSDEVSAVLGLSGLHGPNATGPDGETWIYGADLKMKWRPVNHFRGWPFLILQSEIMGRNYRADRFFNPGPDEIPGTADDIRLPRKTLVDWGLYTQLLWGFRTTWATGIRYDYATGSGKTVIVDFGTGTVVMVSRNFDPFRGDRHRVSPLLVWQPTEFTRFRLQYNYDHLNGFRHRSASSIWLGAEFMLGAHAAHKY
jgi:outer membrane receptor protein involved in Fe transport